jgi:putative endonuclease
MSWYVYIARARTGRFYTGISRDPKSRLKDHNSTTNGAKFAHDQGPFELVYVSDILSDLTQARAREVQIKGWNRKKKEKLISGIWK